MENSTPPQVADYDNEKTEAIIKEVIGKLSTLSRSGVTFTICIDHGGQVHCGFGGSYLGTIGMCDHLRDQIRAERSKFYESTRNSAGP